MTKTIQILKNKEPQILQQNKILLGGQTINLRARQMVYILAAAMDKNNPTEGISIDAKEFLKFINDTPGEKWTDVYSLTDYIFSHLNDNPILIKAPRKKDFIKINWLSRLGVVGGMIQARFSADIAEYFIYKQGLPYTKLLWDLRPYKSKYTARIMDLFQKYHDKRKVGILQKNDKTDFYFDFDIDELKFLFGVHNKYKRFYDFEKNVLKVTKKELSENDFVPYWFDYEKIKKGRFVKTIRFHVEVRSEILLELIPRLKAPKKLNKMQLDIHDVMREKELSNEKQQVFKILTDELNISPEMAEAALRLLTDSQSIAYMYLVDFGVNRNLAFNIVSEQCSFGEIVNYEHFYVKHTIDHIEKARLKRIKAFKEGTSKKGIRITPKDKRGGLAKKVFVEKQHFSSFMEKLSALKKKEEEKQRVLNGHNKKRSKGMSSFGEIMGKMNLPSSTKKSGKA